MTLRHMVPIPSELRHLKAHKYFGRRTVFKFHHQRHQQCFSSPATASIKIGRLHEYRNAEKETLRDYHEGVSTVITDGKATASGLLKHRSMHGFVNAGSGITFDECIFASDLPDFFVYCFSYENTPAAAQSFNDTDPYDSVAECPDILALADFLCDAHPLLQGHGFLCLPVEYRTRARYHTEPGAEVLEEVFEKPPEFSANAEGRILFSRRDRLDVTGAGLIWSDPRLARFFRPGRIPQGRPNQGTPASSPHAEGETARARKSPRLG